MGSFTVTAIPANPDHKVQLTTSGGKSYVFTGVGSIGEAGTGKVEVTVMHGIYANVEFFSSKQMFVMMHYAIFVV